MTHFIDRRLNPKGKSLANRQRFLRRARAQIREAVQKSLKDSAVADIGKERKVKISTKGTKEPRFRLDPTSGGEHDFVLPGTFLMRSGGRPAGREPDDMRDAVQLHSCQTLTPETETTTHYFFQQSHPIDQGDDALTQRIYESLLDAFEEDRRMITAQARNIAINPQVPMLPLAMDSALVQYRRIVERALQADAAPVVRASAA